MLTDFRQIVKMGRFKALYAGLLPVAFFSILSTKLYRQEYRITKTQEMEDDQVNSIEVNPKKADEH